jgi:hypothetical protein
MPQFTRCNRIRALLAIACLALSGHALADVVETVPVVPPADGAYTIANTCIAPLCLENITLGSFVTFSSMISGGNQLTKSDVTLTANAYTDNMGSPGMFVTPVEMTGEADITFFDKNSLSELGTFNTELTSLTLGGTFNLGALGTHDVDAMLNPMQSSDGQTTITQIGPHLYNISSFFDVYAELSIDGGPYVPGPERMANLTPEPSFYWIIGGVTGVMIALRTARRRRSFRTGIASARLTSEFSCTNFRTLLSSTDG